MVNNKYHKYPEIIVKSHLTNLANKLILQLDRQNSSITILHLINQPKYPLSQQHLKVYYLLLQGDMQDNGYKTRVAMRDVVRKLKTTFKSFPTYQDKLIENMKTLERIKLINQTSIQKRGRYSRAILFKINRISIVYPCTIFEKEQSENYDKYEYLTLLKNYIENNEFSCLTKEQKQELPKRLNELSITDLREVIKDIFYKLGVNTQSLEMLTCPIANDGYNRTLTMSLKEKDLYLKGKQKIKEESEKWKRTE